MFLTLKADSSKKDREMNVYPKSPYDKVGGIVYFARMLDKIRMKAAGKLSADYYENLGTGFDGRCVRFLKVTYAALGERVLKGGTDDEILDWCFKTGRRPEDEEILVWNSFMRKRGWREEEEKVTAQLEKYKKERGANQADIATFFDFIDIDEGRKK